MVEVRILIDENEEVEVVVTSGVGESEDLSEETCEFEDSDGEGDAEENEEVTYAAGTVFLTYDADGDLNVLEVEVEGDSVGGGLPLENGPDDDSAYPPCGWTFLETLKEVEEYEAMVPAGVEIPYWPEYLVLEAE